MSNAMQARRYSWADLRARFPHARPHQLRYVLELHKIQPVGKMSNLNLYDENAVAMIERALREIAERARPRGIAGDVRFATMPT